MDGVEDILSYAWSKDSDNLKTALDSVMAARASDIIANMSAEVAASMFGSTVVGNESESVIDEPLQTDDLQTTDLDQTEIEGSTDVTTDEV
jgi:hypothetical protein